MASRRSSHASTSNQCSHRAHGEERAGPRTQRRTRGGSHQRSHSNPGPGVGAASLARPGPEFSNASHTPRGSRHETCPSPVCALATAAMTLLCGPAWGGPAHSSTDPADTLNIEFHWLDRDPTPEERAVMERAGRSPGRRRIQRLPRRGPARSLPRTRSRSPKPGITWTAKATVCRTLPATSRSARDVRFDRIDGLLILHRRRVDAATSRPAMPHGWTPGPARPAPSGPGSV